VLRALGGERLALPAPPALAQRHPRDARHEVELGRPDVAKRRREDLDSVALDPVVVRDRRLRDDVDLVEAHVLRAHVEHLEALARR
jgi:hypothetical protein